MDPTPPPLDATAVRPTVHWGYSFPIMVGRRLTYRILLGCGCEDREAAWAPAGDEVTCEECRFEIELASTSYEEVNGGGE